MTRGRLFVAAVVVVLVAVGVVSLRPTASTAAPAVVPLVASEIVRLDLDGATARRVAPGEWTVSLGGETTWRASVGAVRAALRAATEIASLPALPPVPADFAVLVLRDTAGAERTFRFSEAVIGGRRTVVIDGVAAVSAPVALTDLLLNPGPRSWRERLAFPDAGPVLDRLRIEQPAVGTDPALEIEVVKTGGRWLIVAPVLARADRKAVEAAIARVAGAEITRFIDEARDPLLSGLAEPVFVITIEGPGFRQRVRFGASASAAGAERFASGTDGAVFVADTSLLRELRLDPAAYADRRPVATPAADVAAIEVTPVDGPPILARRTLNGWSPAEFDADALLRSLVSEAYSISFETPEGWQTAARVALLDLSDEPLEIISVGVTADGTPIAACALPGGQDVYFRVPSLPLGAGE